MEDSKIRESNGLTRREALKVSGLALGGLATGGALIGFNESTAQSNETCTCSGDVEWTGAGSSKHYSYYERLSKFHPADTTTKTTIAKLGKDEMRITFMGSSIPLDLRRAQQMMSVFVEVGWVDKNDTDDPNKQDRPLDQFVFDCGSGVCTNYSSMNVGLGRMDKVFLNHLHGDHMSDLTHIYCFGPAADRKSPLYVWGPGQSRFQATVPSNPHPNESTTTYPLYNDGVADYCKALRKLCRWHTESFSFLTTSYTNFTPPTKESWGLPIDPIPVEDTDSSGNTILDANNDGYAIVPIELDWQLLGGTAYKNPDTGVKITHFPVIHTRRGSIGYKLEFWPNKSDLDDQEKPHLTMIYTSDTKPETNCIDQAVNGNKGVDVFIHEMIVPAQVWAMNGSGVLPEPDDPSVQTVTTVQNSSHSPQGAFGHLLSKIQPRPRLTVATHFPVSDDTVKCAMKSVQEHCDVYQGRKPPANKKDAARMTWSFDLMVITVNKGEIIEQRGVVSDFAWAPNPNYASNTFNTPKYWSWGEDSEGNPAKVGDPYAQIDTATAIDACEDGACNYREDGF